MNWISIETILNVWIAMLFYNIVFKALWATLVKSLLSGESGEQVRKSFKERIEDQKRKDRIS